MSSRLGMASANSAMNSSKSAEAVVRAGARLGVVLDAAGGNVEQADALDRAVVEVHVRQLRGAELGLDDLAGRSGDREAVVLAR